MIPLPARQSRTIWKYELPLATSSTVAVSMPKDARVLHVAAGVGGRIFLWAAVNPHAEHERRSFEVRGTGHDLGNVSAYIGTVQAGGYVWHIFHAPTERATS